MTDPTDECTTLDAVIEKENMQKIIIIGGGALGKTKLINRITNTKFQTSDNSNDGTRDFQAASFMYQGKTTLVVDSPGFSHNEDQWWNGVLQMKDVIGVVVMRKHEQRNSDYGHFGYVLVYLNATENNQVLKFVFGSPKKILPDNYMAGSIQVEVSDHEKIYKDTQEWMEKLNRNTTIQIFSPVSLIRQYHKKLEEISRLHSEKEQLRKDHEKTVLKHIDSIKEGGIQIGKLQKECNDAMNEINDLTNQVDRIPQQLANYDTARKEYVPDAPPTSHYLWSWIPGAGSFYLYLLRTKAEQNHAIAIELCQHTSKNQKKR